MTSISLILVASISYGCDDMGNGRTLLDVDSALGETDPSRAHALRTESTAIEVSEVVAQERDLVEPVIGTGTIEAYQVTDIGPLVEGVIDEIFVRVGAHVEEGDPLFQTRSDVFELRKEELVYQVRLAETERRKAKTHLQRTKELQTTGVATLGRLEEAEAQYDMASSRFGIAQSQLKRAEKMLEDCIVTAPYTGVITARAVDQGRFMTPMSGGSRGGVNGILRLMQIDVVSVVIAVPEVHLSRIAKGTRAIIEIDGVEGTFESEITVINDYINPATRSVEVRIELANPNYKIKPGLFAEARLLPEARKVVVLERRAVMGGAGETYVFLNQKGKALRRTIEVVDLDATHVEVISGVSAGVAVLVGPNLSRLDTGSPIRVRRSGQSQTLAYELDRG